MPLILGTNSIKDTGYDVANSLRFNEGSSDSLEYTQSTPTNGKKFTISVWTKFMEHPLGNGQEIIAGGTDGSNETFLRYNNQEKIQFRHEHSSDTNWHVQTNKILRDPSAWYHIVTAVDTTQGTASNRIKLYINGVQETSFATENYPAQNEETFLNKASATVKIGQQAYANNGWFSGYMCEFVFVDGQQLDATSFGEFDSDTNIWKPKNVSGLTFGTNGFYLNVPGVSTGQNANGLGGDSSGNGNHFASSGLSAEDQSTDTCTNNFATMNPLSSVNSTNFTEGNLKINLATNDDTAFSSIAVSKGKWYWEEKRSTQGGRGYTGVCSFDVPEMGGNAGRDASSDFAYTDQNGVMQVSSGATSNSNTKGSALSSGDIICYAFDIDNGQLWTSVNQNINISGTANATGLTTGKDYFYFFEDSGAGSTTIEVNFGSPTFSISSGNTDGDGYGNFEYAVPSGYYALNTKNLAEYG
jgi:hypothetical protein